MITLPILTYHSIDDSGSCLSTHPELFARQMDFLAQNRYQTLTISEANSYLKCGAGAYSRAIALTFDDGYQSVVEKALPVLGRHGFKASLFAVSSFSGRDNSWDQEQHGIPRFRLTTAGEIRGLAQAGWEIGAHSASHRRLTLLGNAELDSELRDCQLFLQDCSRTTVRCLAYPFGVYNPRVRSRASAFYDAACTTDLAYANSASDPYALQRIDAYYLRSPECFRGLASGWMSGYLGLRRWLRKVRSR
jgi:peptidoglycan/xylan/chitin deacetylase (PgdA/CDA1 family)